MVYSAIYKALRHNFHFSFSSFFMNSNGVGMTKPWSIYGAAMKQNRKCLPVYFVSTLVSLHRIF